MIKFWAEARLLPICSPPGLKSGVIQFLLFYPLSYFLFRKSGYLNLTLELITGIGLFYLIGENRKGDIKK